MKNPEQRNGFGTILFLSELRSRLRLLNFGKYVWTATLRKRRADVRPRSRFVDIRYSNPDPVDMPNQLCFRFPVLECVPWKESDPLVCLHPSLADLRSHGLYIEGDEVLRDDLEDFGRFWYPLIAALEVCE